MYIMSPYDNALKEILEKGVKKNNRTGVDTLAVFGLLRKYDISENFPLITKRKIWPKAIFAELLWFLSGSTNNKDLQALGSNIWTPWVNSDFEKEKGYEEGDFGPIYGFQLRHFGANYKSVKKWEKEEKKEKKVMDDLIPSLKAIENLQDYGGYDQLWYIVNELKHNPSSRRILFSLWNPNDLNKQILPCCHYTFQLFVDDQKGLSGSLTQRSCDFFIGVPANIQFYSALIYMLAQQCNLVPKEFVHYTVDAHIYENQIPQVKEYLSREDCPDSPKLILNKARNIEKYKMEDFQIVDYKPLSPIKAPIVI
jgi:thymidylate synthase